MTDYVIVTVQFPTRGFETDMEIPVEMTFEELKLKLFELLSRNTSDAYLQSCRNLTINFNGRTISMNETPAQIGAFNGSRLIVNVS